MIEDVYKKYFTSTRDVKKNIFIWDLKREIKINHMREKE